MGAEGSAPESRVAYPPRPMATREDTLMLFEPGTLWERTVRQSERSLASGDREPIGTERHVVEEEGARFLVHLATAHDRKWEATSKQRERGIDPFMPPYEDELFVADVSGTHSLLLNKFNVIDHHLLLVTRAFEAQDSALGEADFAALWTCMAEFDALAFYNSAPEAGASQPHKHLQLVSLAEIGLTRTSMPDLPVRSCEDPDRAAYVCACSSVSLAARVPPAEAGLALAELYRKLLDEAGVEGADDALSPYNLLLTSDVMVVIPRTRSSWARSGVNGMGYAGSLLAHSAEDLERLREVGPLSVLARVGRTRGEPDGS